MSSRHRELVLLRHGHSEWNLSNRFTGWSDIELTEVGMAEAADCGRELAACGYSFDEVHISYLKRTRQTADALLSAGDFSDLPIQAHWRLNERHYGRLQGMNKTEIFHAWGEERSRRWWRGYHESPPALEHDDPRHPRFEPIYKDLDPGLLPRSESLQQCQLRTLPYWQEEVTQKVMSGQRLLIISHGNTLRAIRMHVEKISVEAVERLEIPSAQPLVYRFSEEMELVEVEQL
jgi:2,3-bisphosphoglycerate-dependent phosphoglycerate mutase